jgi:putative peptidoglycan lipid II flippase
MTPSSVMRHTVTVGACTGLSRALGLAREIAMAACFGTSLAQSAFVVAFRIPNLFRRLFGEGALSAAFVPVFADSLRRDGREGAWELAGRMTVLLGLLMTGLAVAGILVVSGVLEVVTLSEKAALSLALLRIMLPYMIFMCLAALCMAILNSFHHFVTPAAAPIILNVVWLLTLWVLCPRFGAAREAQIFGVAWGILLAGVLQLAVQVPVLVRHGFRGRLGFAWHDARIRRVLILMGPAALGMGLTQVNVLIDTVLAMWIGHWAPAALSFAERLVYLPLGLFATALGTVLLPTFSHQAAAVQHAEIRRTLNRALRGLLVVMVPAAAGLAVLAPLVVSTVFERGAFDARSTLLTARAVRCYAPGLVAFSLYKVLTPAFYALKDTVTPVRIGLRAVGLNLVLNLLFLLTLPPDYKHGGLALATVLAAAANAAALGWTLHRRLGSPGWASIARTGAAALVCAGVMAAVCGWTGAVLTPRMGRGGALAVAVTGGILLYGALAGLVCGRERRELMEYRRKRKKDGT